MKQITINSRTYGTRSVLIDDSDFEYINKFKWFVVKGRNTFYAQRNIRRGKAILMHREILNLTDPKIQGDHKDHNGLNNQRINLRVATNEQNSYNCSPNKKSSSKYLGVSFFKRDKNWSAQIRKDKHQKHLGYFDLEQDAALAYNKAASELYGEFANLNIIETGTNILSKAG